MKPILFNAEMALAVQQGRKTQTRIEIKPIFLHYEFRYLKREQDGTIYAVFEDSRPPYIQVHFKAPYKIGEVIWVREPARVESSGKSFVVMYMSDLHRDRLEIPERFKNAKWITECQGIPNGCIKEMARTSLRVTNVRVERLNEISEEDAIREGIKPAEEVLYRAKSSPIKKGFYYSMSFRQLWESINGKDSFDNRWVWVVEFEVISKSEVMG